MQHLKSTRSFVPFAQEDLNHSIPARFQKQVCLYPDRIAVKTSDRVFTYTTLNQTANRIARSILAQQGSQAEPVALLFESGVDMIASMLGVLKAGKFYIPLDASLPQTRLNYILDDSQASLVLTNHKMVGLANKLCLGQVSVLDIDRVVAGVSPLDLDLEFATVALAYVIYTSGSTGQPKGVIQTHRYVLNLTRTYSNSGHICADDRLALLYSPSFGGAVRDIFCALLNGATLLPFDVKQEGLAQLGQWLNQEAITVFFAVATMFRHFASSLTGDEQFSHLRMIQIGSETVYKQDVDLYQQHFSDDCVLVVNLGGTEISPICQFFVNQTTTIEGSTVPAGYAVEGVEVLLLDEQGQPVEENQIGEIVVKSSDVAIGYWNKSDLTAATFLPDPQGSNARLYKTGDLGRKLPDGCLLHLGRKDFQVKIRGYRVEVTEVEMALLQCDQIREAAVIASPDRNGDRRLVAYFVPTDTQRPPSDRQLRRLLADCLPDYMVPSLFIELVAFPLAPNGKLDRRAFPEPDQLTRSLHVDFIAPRNSIEQRLAAIWSQVLDINPIGIKDHFFELGGHSLQASQVIARIADVFSLQLPLKAIFQFPTLAQLAAQIKNADTSISANSVIIKTVDRSAHLPLSLPQQRLWFLEQLEANKAVYNVFRAFRLTGQIDVVCLERAIQILIERHENLRTTFKIVDDSPVQAITPPGNSSATAPMLPFTLSVVNLQDLPAAERLSKADRIIAEIQNHPFDLTQAPLFRVVLIHLGIQDHRLLVTMHHIITDDWSMQVFLRELSVLYTAFLQGNPSPLPPLTIQYADYAYWQRQWLTGDVLDNQLHYWQRQLADAPPVLDLPTDFPRTSEECFQAGVIPFCLDRATLVRLRALSQRSQTTLFITLLTAFAVLLSRYSNQEDIVIGTGIANRHPVVTEQLIGFFVSTLALRIKLPNNPTFLDLLTQVHQTALDAYAHPDVPFDRLVESLQIERHLNHSPLFQVMFMLQNVSFEALALPGLEAELLELAQPTAGATFDLTLSLKEAAGGLQGRLEYNTRRFERDTIERMATHFQTLLTALVKTPEQSVGLLPLLTPTEKDSCFTGQPTAQDSASQCLHQWFEVQVDKTPDAIAVREGNQQLTYRELNERTNQLAHYLQRKGVNPNTLVGICVERSLEMIVGLLGILKAGGAYVPLDPTYPQARLAYVVNDAQVRILITQSGLVDTLPPCEQVVCLDTERTAIVQQSSENLVSGVQLQNLAYVIYTSGSTGQPKGVLVTHHNAVRLFTMTESWYHFNEQDVWTLFHSYAFDFSVWELWGALLYGGRLVVVPYWTSRDTAAFYNLLVSEQVTVLNQTPSAFYQLIKVDELAIAKLNLRLVIFGGEALDLPSLKPWFDRHGDRHPQLVNMYGITETTVHVTYRPLSLADVNATGSPIGVPIPDLQIYLLDRYQQPVPMGVRGEMYVGGGGVSQGYLNRADLTADRFIPNPFNHSTLATQTSKLYKTGDLARCLPNGELAYLGRIDDQVKIRGFRIELGEIEAILSQHPAIRESVVLVQADRLGDKRLVAYVVPDRQQTLPILKLAELKAQGRLTDYSLYELPNGMVITHLNQSETEFLYQEIFAAKSYLQHGIEINPGECIFDVGANIGLFTLFAAQVCPNVEVYAFEPIPPIFDCLRLNAELYDLNVKLFDSGLSSEAKQDTFTYYPNVSAISGCFADVAEEKEVVKSFLLNQQAMALYAGSEIAVNQMPLSQETLEELLAKRLQSEQFTCQLRSLSDVIYEHQVEQIDLLKIDVKKSERDVLAGIQADDWQKIKQIVVEVHDINGRLTEITDLLKRHGYDLTVVQDRVLEETPLYNIYARQLSAKPTPAQKTDIALSDRPTWSSLNRFIQDIRHYLKDKLPEYMLPAEIVVLETFPLTANGKVDRRALPAPENTHSEFEDRFVPPTTPIETTLAGIWAEILQLSHIGIHDNFFDLGGHSLLATSLVFRIRQAFAIDFPLRYLFEAPTVAALSKLIESFKAHPTLSSNGIPSTLPAMSRLERSPSTPVPLSLSQQDLWFLHQSARTVATLNSSTLMRVRGSLSLEVVEQSLNEIVRRHETLRTVFTVINDRPMQIVLPHLHLPLVYKNLQHLSPEARQSEAVRLGIQVRQQPFNLAVAPLIRAALFQLNPEEHWLVITMHHIITDGWSFGVLLQELDILMQAFTNGRPSPLPALSCQYADFALWQQQVYNEAAIAQQLSYWQRQLVDDELHPSPGLMLSSKQAGHRFIHLPESLVRSVEGLGRSQSVTSFVILLSAFKLALAKWSQQNEILILATLGNRTGPATEQMIGCFINDVILRSRILPEQTGATVIQQLQETVNEAIEHKEVPLHRVFDQIQHLRPLNLLASITMTPSVQDQMPGWEAIAPEQWGDMPMELYGRTPPLELYVELSKTIRIRAKYGTEKFTAETIDRLLSDYHKILTQLVSHSEMTVSDLFKTISSELNVCTQNLPDF